MGSLIDLVEERMGDRSFLTCGAIIPFMRTEAPSGFLVCNGAEYLKTDFPQLAAVLGAVDTAQSTTTFAGSDSDHFKVPDLRGEFLRGTGTNSHTDEGSGGDVGEHQTSTSLPFFYVDGRSAEKAKIGATIPTTSPDSFHKLQNYFEPYNVDSHHRTPAVREVHYSMGRYDTWSENNPYSVSARPTNTSVLYCIAYQDVYVTIQTADLPTNVVAPQDGQILVYSASQQRWINGGHKYSTNEHIVGTWIDGRPVYEIVLVGTLPTTSTNGVLVTNVAANLPSDAKNLVKLEPIWYGDAGATTWSGAFPVIDTMYSAGLGFTNIYCANDGSVTISNSIARYSGRRVYITVQYTKTTDTPTV